MGDRENRAFRPATGRILAAMLAAGLLTAPAHAQEGTGGGISSWPSLTNDWFGHGAAMREAGVDLQLEWRQYYQGMTKGSGDHDPVYGGQLSLKTTLDLSKMGFWDGFSISAQALAKHGRGLNHVGGTLLPVNAGLFFPGQHGADRYDLSALFVTQKISDTVSASFGKFYTVEMARGTPLRGGVGADTFWHLQFSAPMNGLIPAQINGAVISVATQPVSYTLMIFDPVDATNKPLFSDLFDKGVVVSGTATYATKLGGHDGYYSLTGMYSTKEGADFSQIIVPAGASIGHRDGAWLVGISFQQYLHQNPTDPSRGWGVFGEVNIADGNPNPLEWSASLGVAGNDLIPSRPDDKFGLGLFHFATSRALKDELAPYFELGDESGFEMFYTASMTPWFHVTADLQYIDPAPGNAKNGVFVGIGSSVKF
ncbi:carbohydrate porin [Paracoccus lutimaris]|uniref:Porin n=1 Tax=Paracoccus lutimaris TaxID=1490030 RepID=A0A368Z3V7_9RHOB|nr:carbohydrate porin [Paracoccus lutimaris]RCW87142.1 porin [Paracoccus lutimaris]